MESNMTHAYLFSDGKRNFAFCLFCFGFFFWRNSKSLQNQQNNNSNPQVSSACSTLKQFLLLSVADFSSEISINVRLVHILFWKVLATDSKHTQPTDVTTNATDDLCDFFAVVELREPEQGGSRGAKLKSTWNQNRTLPCNDRILWKLTLQQQKYTKPRLITFATRYKTAQNDLFLYVNKRNARTGQEDRAFNCIITRHLVKFGPRLDHSGRSLI